MAPMSLMVATADSLRSPSAAGQGSTPALLLLRKNRKGSDVIYGRGGNGSLVESTQPLFGLHKKSRLFVIGFNNWSVNYLKVSVLQIHLRK